MWIKCSDRLPEEEGDYLVVSHNNHIMVARFRSDNKTFSPLTGMRWLYPDEQIANWQFLPNLPIPEKKKTGLDHFIEWLEAQMVAYLNYVPTDLKTAHAVAKRIKEKYENT